MGGPRPLRRLAVRAALAGGDRVAQHRRQLLRRERLQRVHAHAREQRAVDLERGVLGRGADQRHEPLLDRRQQRVLLGLVEAVDLVEEQHRLRAAGVAAVGGALDHRAHLRAPGRDRAQLLERRPRALGDDPRERRLARSRRPVEHHRVRVALLDRGAQRRAVGEQVRLADELLEGARAHAHGQRAALRAVRASSVATRLVASGRARIPALTIVEQGVHAREYRWCGKRPFHGSGRVVARVVERVDSMLHVATSRHPAQELTPR